MTIRWTRRALADLGRLHDLADKSPRAARQVVLSLVNAPARLRQFPRVGTRLPQFDGEVRRLMIGDYELRYEIIGETIWILQLWHCREGRWAEAD